MDGYEATRIVFSRIQNLDPENASKIMGLLLLQDHGEKEMIRLAFGPETLIHSLILKAKVELGISLPSNSPINSPSTPPSPSPFLPTNQKISTSTPTITIPRHNSSSTPWNSNFSADFPNPDEFISPNNNSTMNSSALPFYGSSNNNSSNGGGISDIIDEFQLQDQLSFLNDNVDSNNMILPSYWGGGGVHRRSCSVSEVMGCGGGGDNDLNSGFGWRPCLYFARGYCKNGSSCRFIHGSGIGDQPDGPATMVGSPSKIETTMDQCHELLRSKSAAAQHQQQQRLAAAAVSFPFSPKGMNLFLQQQQNEPQRAAAAALMMNEDIHKFSRSRLERNDFSTMVNPASRQIYLTFPADSTFREEDVSNYFSIYGPVQDVRIPYQQKRMFGFVTFVYPETVKMILAKGNPHFVCDARVLVKPYKEKGKVPDKFRKQQQQMERGEYSSPCGTPTGLDSRDPFDLQLGARMLYNSTQDMLWRRKMEEQADLQQAIELQSRRLMNLQLLDVKNKHHQRALSTGSPIPSPTNHSPNLFHQNLVLPPFHTNTSDIPHAEKCSSPLPNISLAGGSLEKQSATDGGAGVVGDEENGNGNGNGKKSFHIEDGDLLGSLEHNLPDSPFASPTKGCGEYMTAFSKGASSSSSSSTENNNLVAPANLVPASSSLDMASFKSFNCQIPRFSSGHGGAIGMYSGSGGPTCPVGI